MSAFRLLDLPPELVHEVCMNLLPPCHPPNYSLYADASEFEAGLAHVSRFARTCKTIYEIISSVLESYRANHGFHLRLIPYARRILNDSTLAEREIFFYVDHFADLGPILDGDHQLLTIASTRLGVQPAPEWLVGPEAGATEVNEREFQPSGPWDGNHEQRASLIMVILMSLPNLTSMTLPADFNLRHLPRSALPSLRHLRLLPSSGNWRRDQDDVRRILSLTTPSPILRATSKLETLELVNPSGYVAPSNLSSLKTLIVKAGHLSRAGIQNILNGCNCLERIEYSSEGSVPEQRLAGPEASPHSFVEELWRNRETLQVFRVWIRDSSSHLPSGQSWHIDTLKRFRCLREIDVMQHMVWTKIGIYWTEGEKLRSPPHPRRLINFVPTTVESFGLGGVGSEFLPAIVAFAKHCRAGHMENLKTFRLYASRRLDELVFERRIWHNEDEKATRPAMNPIQLVRERDAGKAAATLLLQAIEIFEQAGVEIELNFPKPVEVYTEPFY